MTGSWHVAHDFAFSFGGAERVTKVMADSLTQAGSTVLGGDRETMASLHLANPAVVFPRVDQRTYRPLSLVLPRLLARREPIEGDLLASSYAYCHLLPNHGKKVVYCHSPLRQVWSGRGLYRSTIPRPARPLFDRAAASFRKADVNAARAADLYIANSTAVRARIAQFYGLSDIPLLAPPVEGKYFYMEDGPRDDFFLFAGRIVEPYKRLSLILEAFEGIDARVVVAGDGRDRARLEASAPSNVEFIGRVDSARLGDLYRCARALLFPSEDDFGMTPAEAIACGTPVIAYRGGGSLDTVTQDESGVFFDEPTARSLQEAVHRFLGMEWSRQAVAAASRVHDEKGFSAELVRLLDQV